MSDKQTPDWLPAGWIAKRIAGKTRKYMCYIDPLNELKFYSKPEVLRHLKKEGESSSQKSDVRKAQSDVRNGISEHTENNVCYHYLSEVRKVESDARKGTSEHAENNGHSTSKAEKSAEEGTNAQITEYDSWKLVKTVIDELTLESTETENTLFVTENASEPCIKNMAVGNVKSREKSSPSLPRRASKRLAGVEVDLPKEVLLQDSGIKNMEVGDVTIPEASGLDALEEKAEKELKMKQAIIQDKKKKSGEKSNPSFPRRASKRLAGVEVDLPKEVLFQDSGIKNTAVGDVTIPEANGLDALKEKAENELIMKQAIIQDKKKKSGEKSNPSYPRRASKRLAGVEVDLPKEFLLQDSGIKNMAVGDVTIPEASGLDALEEKTENELKEKQSIIQDKKKMSGEKSNPSLPLHASKRLAGVEVDLPKEVVLQDSGVKNIAVGDVTIPEANGLDSLEEKSENELKEKQAIIQDKKRKSREKSNPSLPRRASKRLAGVEVDLPRKSITRCQSAARQESEVKTPSACLASSAEKQVNSVVLLPHVTNLPYNNQRERQDGDIEMETKPEGRPDGNAEADKKANEMLQLPIVLTPEVKGIDMTNVLSPPILSPEEHVGAKLVMDKIPNEKLNLPNDLPLESVSTSREDQSKKVEEESNDKSNGFSLVDIIMGENRPGDMVTDNNKTAVIKPESPMNLSLTDLWSDPCIEFAVKTLTGEIPVGVEENKGGVDTSSSSGPPLDLPFGGFWDDPCIEFAVKTLTGGVPFGEDLNVQDYFQQNACSSSESQHVGLAHFSQNEFAAPQQQHFNSAQKSFNKQQECVLPSMLPNHINGNLQLPSGHHQHGKGNNNGDCSRQTFF